MDLTMYFSMIIRGGALGDQFMSENIGCTRFRPENQQVYGTRFWRSLKRAVRYISCCDTDTHLYAETRDDNSSMSSRC